MELKGPRWGLLEACVPVVEVAKQEQGVLDVLALVMRSACTT